MTEDVAQRATAQQSPPSRRATGRARRKVILEAVLRLIAREGVRSIRHRAVAAEAGVPLAATTYYFKDIGALLKESFEFFAARLDGNVDTFRDDMFSMIAALENMGQLDEQGLQEVRARMVNRLTAHIMNQAGQRDQRAIELAFRQESLRDAGLRELINARDNRLLSYMIQGIDALGSSYAELDARLSLAVILRLESEVAFAGLEEETVHAVMDRHLQHLLQA